MAFDGDAAGADHEAFAAVFVDHGEAKTPNEEGAEGDAQGAVEFFDQLEEQRHGGLLDVGEFDLAAGFES